MRKLLYSLCALSVILVTSCAKTPAEKATDTVKSFVEAVSNGNISEANALYPGNDIISPALLSDGDAFSVSSDSVSSYFKGVLAKPENLCKIIGFKGVDGLEITNAIDNSIDINASLYDYDSSIWSKVKSICHVITKYNGQSIDWFVGIREKDNPIILNTNGIFTADTAAMKKEFGCDITLLDGKNDTERFANMKKALVDIFKMKQFEWYFNRRKMDLASFSFPRIKNRVADIKPEIQTLDIDKYAQRSENTAMASSDSISFLICNEEYNNCRIEDCKGLLNYAPYQKAITDYGRDFDSPDSKWDCSYISSQIEKIKNIEDEIQAEKEREEAERVRKARAAKYLANGAALLSHEFVTGKDGDDITKGITFSVLNLSKSDIKYVRLDIVGYNVVDDPVWDGGYIQRVNGIGPISEGESGTWSFDKIWTMNPKIVHSYEIKSMTVELKNGRTKTIKLPEVLPSNYRDWLY